MKKKTRSEDSQIFTKSELTPRVSKNLRSRNDKVIKRYLQMLRIIRSNRIYLIKKELKRFRRFLDALPKDARRKYKKVFQHEKQLMTILSMHTAKTTRETIKENSRRKKARERKFYPIPITKTNNRQHQVNVDNYNDERDPMLKTKQRLSTSSKLYRLAKAGIPLNKKEKKEIELFHKQLYFE